MQYDCLVSVHKKKKNENYLRFSFSFAEKRRKLIKICVNMKKKTKITYLQMIHDDA